MFDRIVLAVESPDQSRGAVAAAIDLATKSGGEVLVVHVHDTGLVYRETVDLETHEEARLLVQAALEVVINHGVEARSELRSAQSTDVAREILRAARGFGADTVVLGSRGLGDFAGLLLGSVAHRVIQLADCPVVVVRADAAASAAHDREAAQAAGAR
ncbi:MAG: universal stress protein [Thermoleophilia bacterium]